MSFHGKCYAQYILDITPLNEVRLALSWHKTNSLYAFLILSLLR